MREPMREIDKRAAAVPLYRDWQRYLPASLLIAAALVLLLSLPALAGKELTKQKAQELLGPLLRGASVYSVSPSPLQGTWEVVISVPGGDKTVVYFDDRKMLLFTGALIDLKTRANLTQARQEAVNKVSFSSIPLGDALVMGKRDAKYKVVVFDDPD